MEQGDREFRSEVSPEHTGKRERKGIAMSGIQQPPPEGPVWYYMMGQQRMGPVPMQTIFAMIENGAVQASALVWREGMEAWAPAGGCPEFSFAFRGNLQNVLTSKREFALGLTTGGFILFIVLLVMCLPLCWLPWVIDDLKAKR